MSLALDAVAQHDHVRCPDKKRGKPPPLSAAQTVRADAVIAALARLWPRCFHVYEGRRRPLAIGIDRMLIEHMQPAIKAGRLKVTLVLDAAELLTVPAPEGRPRITLRLPLPDRTVTADIAAKTLRKARTQSARQPRAPSRSRCKATSLPAT